MELIFILVLIAVALAVMAVIYTRRHSAADQLDATARSAAGPKPKPGSTPRLRVALAAGDLSARCVGQLSALFLRRVLDCFVAAASTVRRHRYFTWIQRIAYPHRAAVRGSNHWAGSLSPSTGLRCR